MDHIEKRVLDFIQMAIPANDDRPTLRLARQERVDQLLQELNHKKPRATVYLRGDISPLQKAI